MTLISNSDVNSYSTCERRHYYAFRERLAPTMKTQSVALTRGIVGHEALEVYYGHKQTGMSKEYCVDSALAVISSRIEDTPEFTKEFTQLKELIRKYADYYWHEPWRILEIEKQHEFDLSLLEKSIEGVKFGMRLDLLVEAIAGPNKGRILLVDHKFVYDFFSDKDLELNPQMIKYMKTLREEGIPVHKAILNQVRYRSMKSNDPKLIFRRDDIKSTPLEMHNIMDNHAQIAGRIDKLYKLPQHEHYIATTMHMETNTCKYCSFLPLCKEVLNGKDPEPTKKVLYERNTYADQYDRN